MNFLIIGFILLSLVGSVMWVMPSKRDRFLAKLRMDAKRQGFQVQLVKVAYPRERNEIEALSKSAVAYRLPRTNLSKEQSRVFKSWRVVRCETNACEGLVQGWGWSIGERELSEHALDQLNTLLPQLPDEISGLELTPIQASIFWRETEKTPLNEIHETVTKLLEFKV